MRDMRLHTEGRGMTAMFSALTGLAWLGMVLVGAVIVTAVLLSLFDDKGRR